MNTYCNLTLFVFLVFLSSCMDSKLPKYVELNSLRVLSLISDKPEVQPTNSVTITPIISDITETSTLSYQAVGCIDPGVALGVEPTCTSNPTKLSLAQGTITSASNSDMAQNFTGTAPSFIVVIPTDTVIFNQRSDVEKYNGLTYLVEYKLTNSKNQTVTSVKRILVSNKSSAEQNSNPVVTQLQSNGTALGNNDFPTAGKFNINILFSADSIQTYTLKKEDGTAQSRSEDLTTTWFITDGSLKYFRSSNQESNVYTAPDGVSPTRKSFLISISRDSRGGVTYKRICGGC